MAHDVFISYSSKDKPIADAICATMEKDGLRCWMAPRDILPGSDWGESIVHAIAGSRVFVLVLSHSANTSQQIKREVERAVNRGLPVIPYRIEDVMPAESLEYFLSTPHWLDAFSPPVERHAQYLSDAVKRLLNETPDAPWPAPPTPSPTPPPPPPAPVRLPAWLAPLLKPIPLAVIAAALLVAIALGAYLTRPTTFVGSWTSSNINWSPTVAQNFSAVSLGELIGPTVTGPTAVINFSVGPAGQYQCTGTSEDHGTVVRDGKNLIFTSSTGQTSVVAAGVIANDGGNLAMIGGRAGEPALYVQGAGKLPQAWVGQLDDMASGGAMGAFTGAWTSTNLIATPDGRIWQGALTISANGAYDLKITEKESGSLQGANGHYQKTFVATTFAPNGGTDAGTYQFSGHNAVTMTETAGAFTYKRAR